MIYSNRKVIELIQVALSITDNKTYKREIRALLVAAKELNVDILTLVTLDHKEEIMEENVKINIIPIIDWLLA